MKNLDLLAAQAAQTIIKNTKTKKVKGADETIKASEVDNLITKALGVLQENGVYAGLLYLYSRTNNTDMPIAGQTREVLLSLTAELELPVPKDRDVSANLKFLTDHVCNNLDRLLLVKQLWEQTLIYARYGAKARIAAGE